MLIIPLENCEKLIIARANKHLGMFLVLRFVQSGLTRLQTANDQ